MKLFKRKVTLYTDKGFMKVYRKDLKAFLDDELTIKEFIDVYVWDDGALIESFIKARGGFIQWTQY